MKENCAASSALWETDVWKILTLAQLDEKFLRSTEIFNNMKSKCVDRNLLK